MFSLSFTYSQWGPSEAGRREKEAGQWESTEHSNPSRSIQIEELLLPRLCHYLGEGEGSRIRPPALHLKPVLWPSPLPLLGLSLACGWLALPGAPFFCSHWIRLPLLRITASELSANAVSKLCLNGALTHILLSDNLIDYQKKKKFLVSVT